MQQGGNVIVSFGGANGAELAQNCTSGQTLQAQYRAAIDRYKLTHIDLDIEGAAVTDTAANDRRNKAIRALQQEADAQGRQLIVSYTLQVMPTGLTQAGSSLLQNAVANDVDVSTVTSWRWITARGS